MKVLTLTINKLPKQLYESYYNSYLQIEQMALQECKQHYPQHLDKIRIVLTCVKACMLDPTKEKVMHSLMSQLHKISDYIEIEINGIQSKDWHNPIALERGLLFWITKEFSSMLVNPFFKADILHDLKQQAFYNTDFGKLFEQVLCNGFCTSTELANTLGISDESINNEIEQLMKRKKKKL